MAALLHFALKLKQGGIRKNHHGNATHESVRPAIVNPIRTSRVGEGGEGLRYLRAHGLQGQAAAGTHDVSRQGMRPSGPQGSVLEG